jgi:hypothetical protein
MPGAVFSGRESDRAGTFFCYSLPALDNESGTFTLTAGTTRWYLQVPDGTIVEDLARIADVVRSSPATERVVAAERGELRAAKTAVEAHIKKTYLRALDVPLDAPSPALVGWMDLVSG